MERRSGDEAFLTSQVRRAGNLAALAVVVFAAFYWVSTQVDEVRAASPWAEDPPDAVVSVAAMLVAFVTGITFVRVQRRQPDPVIPAAARRDILHGFAVVVAAIWLAAAAAVVALATGTRAAAWDGSLGLLLGLLMATVAAVVPASFVLRRAWPAGRTTERRDDFLVDTSAFLRVLAGRLPGPARWPLSGVAGWVDRLAEAPLGPRRAPWLTVIGVAVLAAVGLVVVKFLTEGLPPPSLVGQAVLVLGGIMAAIVIAGYLALGRYLNLIGPPAPRG